MKFLATNLRKFKVVTFDCTNTLFFFKKPPEQQYLITAKTFGLKSENFDMNLMKVNFRKQFKELQISHPNFGKNSIQYNEWWRTLVSNVFTESSREKIDPKVLEPIAASLINQYKSRECWGKFEKTNELIQGLKDAGKIVGVISNFDPRLHELMIDMKVPQLDFVVTSYEAGFMKPNPGIFHKAIEAAGCDPSEALHIGNEVDKDYEGARSAGWNAVLISPEANAIQPSFKSVEAFWEAARGGELKL